MKKRSRKISEEPFEVLRLWTYPEAVNAMPYLRGIAASLREHWLEVQNKGLQISRLSNRPGRPGKQELLDLEDARREHDRAEEACRDALQEMLNMHVFPSDVQQGLALIPFRMKEELAWFVFDLFEGKGLLAWRFHQDPPTQRRPIDEVLETAAAPVAAG